MSCNNLALSVDRERDRRDTGFVVRLNCGGIVLVTLKLNDNLIICGGIYERFSTLHAKSKRGAPPSGAGHIADKPSMSGVGWSAGLVMRLEIEIDLSRLNIGWPFPTVSYRQHK